MSNFKSAIYQIMKNPIQTQIEKRITKQLFPFVLPRRNSSKDSGTSQYQILYRISLICYNRVQMRIVESYIFLLLLLLLSPAIQRTVNFTTLNVSPYKVDSEWEDIAKVLEGPPIKKLVFKQVHVCNEGLKRILAREQVKTSLESLFFQDVFLNQEMMRTLWQNPRTYSLTNLTLKDNALEDEDFRLVSTQKEIDIELLDLQSNFISAEGFEYLSKLKMNKIKSIHLYGLSMVTDESVNNFLKMNLTNLKQLNIGFTALSEENAIKIFRSINTSSLTYLNISKNSFTANFYQDFSSFNFSSLETLDVSNLLIDEDAVTYLKDMQFPELTTLNIGGNQFFMDGLYTFLNKRNYPKLKNLRIRKITFDTAFFAYLTKQFHETRFQVLQFIGGGVEPQVFQHLKSLNLQDIKIFTLAFGFMKYQIVQGFFNANQFQFLEELNLEFITNAGSILHKIMEKNWPMLKILRLGRIGNVDFNKLLSQVKPMQFPQLENLAMDARSYSSSEVQKLIQILSKAWPTFVHMQMFVTSSEKLTRKMSQGLLRGIQKQILVTLKEYTLIDEYRLVMRFILNPNEKPVISSFNYYKTLKDEYANLNAKANQETYTSKELDKFEKEMRGEYFDNFNFSSLNKLEDKKDCPLLSFIAADFEKANKKCLITHVLDIEIVDATNECFKVFSKCRFPNSHTLSIGFNKSFTSNQSDFQLFKQNFSQLIYLTLKNEDNVPNEKVIHMFKEQQFPLLMNLEIISSDMRSEEFEKILSVHPNMRRIKAFEVASSRIKELAFLPKLKMKLRRLHLAAEIIGDGLVELSNLNFQFMRKLNLAGTGITNEIMIQFLSKMPKRKTSFPRIDDLKLHFNYIETEGNQKLFEAGLPMLELFLIHFNRDPEIVNTLLGSAKSHRLNTLIFYKNEENSIDSNLNIKNTRELREIIMQTSSLQATDFRALSKMDFHMLQKLTILFSRIFECENLKHILKMASTVLNLYLGFDEEVMGIDSQCLSGEAKSDQNLKHLKSIQIVIESPINSNLRNFFDLIVFDQVLINLILRGVYPSQSSLRKIAFQANLDYLNVLDLSQNDLNDEMVQEILNRDFKQATVLNIGFNAKLTSNAIKFMRNRTYPELRYLDVSRTSIDDAGLEIILSCKFPSLNSINLASMEITGKLLQRLSNLEAPNLNEIDLSNNNLKLSDLMKFNPSKFNQLQAIKLLPYLSSQSYEKLNELYNKDRKKSKQVAVVAQILNIQGSEEEILINGSWR